MYFFDKLDDVILCAYKSSCQHITLQRNLKFPSCHNWGLSHYTVQVRVRFRNSAIGIGFVQIVRETRSFPLSLDFPSLWHSSKFRILIKCVISSYYLKSLWNTTLFSHWKNKLRLILKPTLKFIDDFFLFFWYFKLSNLTITFFRKWL
jgi:hypothetical protein